MMDGLEVKEESKYKNIKIEMPFKDFSFNWTEELVLEFARKVALEYHKSEKWTLDYVAEQSMAREFKVEKTMQKMLEYLAPVHYGEELHVDREKFDEFIEQIKRRWSLDMK